MHDSAVLGVQLFFLPAPISSPKPYFILAGVDVYGEKLYEVPSEFYPGVFQRLAGIFELDNDDTIVEMQVEYAGLQYTFRAWKTSTPCNGVVVNIFKGAGSRANA